MEFLLELFRGQHITAVTAIIRVTLAFVAGGIVGVERESHNEQAGMRTHILICMGASLLTVVSIYIPQSLTEFTTGDPARVAAQVVSGIGFLGAGAIVRLGVNVRGLTTSASIWVVAAIGLAMGAGLYVVGFAVSALVLFTLYVLSIVEDKLFPKRQLKRLEIIITGSVVEVSALEDMLRELRLPVRSTEVHHSFGDEGSRYAFLVHFPRAYDHDKLYRSIGSVDGVVGFSLEDTIG
jgi:putative Mg2+ transporter-C (MgtC) family protein